MEDSLFVVSSGTISATHCGDMSRDLTYRIPTSMLE